jgi:CheY-like chemotaxis protein
VTAGDQVILLVEDDDGDAKLIVRALKKTALPGRLEVVRTGTEAIAYVDGVPPYDDRARHPSPALIILDLRMPGLDGYDVLKVLGSRSDMRRVPIMVLTAVGEAASVRRTYELGASIYFVKPSAGRGYAAIAREMENYWLACSGDASSSSGASEST